MKGRLTAIASTYFASFIIVGSIIPIIASFIALLLYLTLPRFPVLPILGISSQSQWYTLAYSSFFAVVLWILIAIPFSQFCRAKYAQARNFDQIMSRLHQLQAYLQISDAQREDNFARRAGELGYEENDNRHIIDILKEAFYAYKEANENINDHNGLAWIMCTGYNSVWTLIHHAEETLIEVAKSHVAIRGAKHDFEAICNSKLQRGKQERLLKDIENAVKALQSTALIYFNDPQPNPESTPFVESSPQIIIAKGILREVRSALNDYRDKLWESLARQKIRLLVSITITGIVTYALLSLIIMANKPPEQEDSAVRLCFIAAIIFYLIGAITGLFSRLYFETRRKASGDDLGLGKARLVATILLSGLAGLLGVIFTEALSQLGEIASLIEPAKGLSIPRVVISDVFSLNPMLWFMAAIFGLTPNLFIQVLQRKTDQYLSELQSTSTAKGTLFKNPGSQLSNDEGSTEG